MSWVPVIEHVSPPSRSSHGLNHLNREKWRVEGEGHNVARRRTGGFRGRIPYFEVACNGERWSITMLAWSASADTR